MKAKNEHEWSLQVAELTTTDEASRKFYDFLICWLDRAEELLDDDQQNPKDSLIAGFELAEQTLGFLSVEWLGQMLLIIVQHWFNGDSVWETLSVWERRLVEQATALKIAELQQEAAADDSR